MAKVAVVLSGSGVNDGSEIHEATLALLHLDERGAEVQCFAPDIEQRDVINHYTSEEIPGAKRNVLVEAARIARGDIKPLSELKAAEYDAVVLPGGFGAAKNLCDFAIKGVDCDVDDETARVILEFSKADKVVAPMCIAPAVVARVLGSAGVKVTLTIGNDADTAKAIEEMGARHQDCPVDQAVVDRDHRVVSTPAYMLGPSIKDVSKGIRALVDAVIELA